MILWWIGFGIVLTLIRKVLLALTIRFGLCYWNSALDRALKPNSVTDEYPAIVIAVAEWDTLVRQLIKQIAAQWPLHPIVLVLKKPDAIELEKSLDAGDGLARRERLTVVELETFGSAVWQRSEVLQPLAALPVGLLISCGTSMAAAMPRPASVLSAVEVQEEVDASLRAHMMLTRLVLPAMMKRKAGAIVAIGSQLVALSEPGYSVQVATRKALQTFSEALQIEVRHSNILVQCWEAGCTEPLAAPTPWQVWLATLLQRSDEAFCNRALRCLRAGATAWVFPLGYTPTTIAPCMTHALFGAVCAFTPGSLLDRVRNACKGFSVF